MSITYLIEFSVQPLQRERFLTLLNGVLDAMREEANFRSATLHRDPADPYHFLLHETWANHQDLLEVQLHRGYRREWDEALPELLERPRQLSIWSTVRADRA